MKELLKAGAPMAKTCLFYPYNGEVQATWNLFARGSDEANRCACLKWFRAQNLNCITFFLNNPDAADGNLVSFFGDDLVANYGRIECLDWKRVETLIYWMDTFNSAGIMCVPCLYCDDGNYIVTQDWAKHDAFLKLCLQSLNNRVAGWIIGCESNKWTDPVNRVQTFYNMAKQYTNLPVGSHLQGYSYPLMDFVSFEHTWHPKYGDDKSVTDCVNEAQRAVAAAVGRPVVCLEYNLNPTGQTIRDQAEAMSRVPGVAGVGGPF
jgi:hypothetical protein